MDLTRKLEESSGFDEVFEVVKVAVENGLGLRRGGLSLVLADIPTHIGAYHVLGSNFIVVNKTILDEMSEVVSDKPELNSFLFSILTHEYLHSLGITNEGIVRELVRDVAEDNFGKDHVAYEVAKGDLWTKYPELKKLRPKDDPEMEIVRGFDPSSTPYIA